ncbi:MAG: 16S rRNA (adenine(1518)-N(6)/adenine(1519)-N(6))-dimethyltransferase RsmA [Deltaproteobacteria bacterium]|nr:16S rRNA (adenine(1518)-N(6)/adenine(1519)-N(6))-dimethyltransferase RsmA [Deltaproteobacteria bacterium]
MVSLYQEVREALRESDFRPKKRLGQNFLIHESTLQKIPALLELSADDEVLEIGPGLGFLTRKLVQVARKVWAIELDPLLVDRLRRSALGSHPALELVHGDILKADLSRILPPRKIKLVANLPYSISTPVLFRIFEFRERFSLLVLMVQREVAERMAAVPSTKSYGTLSVWCRIHGRIVDKIPVSPEAFFPQPRVRSMILKLALNGEPFVGEQEMSRLRSLVRFAFGQRRKTLANALAGLAGFHNRDEIEAFLWSAGIDPKRRGETLTVEEFVRLSRTLGEKPGAGA